MRCTHHGKGTSTIVTRHGSGVLYSVTRNNTNRIRHVRRARRQTVRRYRIYKLSHRVYANASNRSRVHTNGHQDVISTVTSRYRHVTLHLRFHSFIHLIFQTRSHSRITSTGLVNRNVHHHFIISDRRRRISTAQFRDYSNLLQVNFRHVHGNRSSHGLTISYYRRQHFPFHQ